MEIKNRKQWDNGGVSFTLALDNGVEIHGCKVAKGTNGAFVAGPSRKGNDGKYYPWVYIPKDIGNAVLRMLEPAAVDDSDIPF